MYVPTTVRRMEKKKKKQLDGWLTKLAALPLVSPVTCGGGGEVCMTDDFKNKGV